MGIERTMCQIQNESRYKSETEKSKAKETITWSLEVRPWKEQKACLVEPRGRTWKRRTKNKMNGDQR